MWWVESLEAMVILVVVAFGEPLHCQHKQCRYLGNIDTYNKNGHRYLVDGIELHIYDDGYYVSIACSNGSLLELNALPRAEPELIRKTVSFNCPPPPNGSVVDALTALNIKLDYNVLSHYDFDYVEPQEGLIMRDLPPEPPLSARHLKGLENLTGFMMYAPNRTSPEKGFLAPLRSLRMMYLNSIDLPDGVLETPPPEFEQLFLKNCTGMERLPAALQSAPNFKYFVAWLENCTFDVGSVPPAMGVLRIYSDATTLRLDTAPSLEWLEIDKWTEPRPVPLERCNVLRWLELHDPAMVELPNGWLANCPKLACLSITGARHLSALPPRLLRGATTISDLIISGGVLETLPIELLAYTPNLLSLKLQGNRLRTIPSGMFEVPQMISWLDLSSNELDLCALDAPALLPHLERLNLNDNKPPNNQTTKCSSP